MSRTRVSVLAATSPAVALAAPAAQAHVTLNPRSVTANSFGRLDVRVPNERDDAGTKTVVVYFPDGFYSRLLPSASGAGRRRSRCASSPRRSRATDGDITERGREDHLAGDLEGGLDRAGLVRGVRALDADPEHAGLDAVLPGAPDLQQRRGRQLERRRRRRDAGADRQRGGGVVKRALAIAARRSSRVRRAAHAAQERLAEASNSTRTARSARSARRSRPRCRPGHRSRSRRRAAHRRR